MFPGYKMWTSIPNPFICPDPDPAPKRTSTGIFDSVSLVLKNSSELKSLLSKVIVGHFRVNKHI